MKEYTTPFIRNVALISHSSAGKTMLAEACLHYTGATTRLGKIEDGTTSSDYDEEELRRKISLYTSVIPVEYKDVKINLLDTPDYTDFVGEVISALRVADGAGDHARVPVRRVEHEEQVLVEGPGGRRQDRHAHQIAPGDALRVALGVEAAHAWAGPRARRPRGRRGPGRPRCGRRSSGRSASSR